MTMLNQAQIEERLPHRAPILLLASVEEWVADKHLVAKRPLPANDPVFAGHFPDHPILPGVLGVEALAQAGALLTNLTDDYTAAQTQFLFRSIHKVSFRQPILPGDTMTLAVTQIQKRGGVYKFEGQVRVADKLCTEASFTAMRVVKS
jgi:3-hydroxyacyl-[acyl-carrier-protein] dehydratase